MAVELDQNKKDLSFLSEWAKFTKTDPNKLKAKFYEKYELLRKNMDIDVAFDNAKNDLYIELKGALRSPSE
jgi:hypothetical protein